MRRLILTAIGALCPAAALAQSAPPSQTAIDVQNFWPASGPTQSFSLRSTDVQPHLSLGFSLLGNMMWRPVVFTDSRTGAQADVVHYAITTDFVWGVGLFDRVQIGIATPLVVAQEGLGAELATGQGGIAAQLPQFALRDIRFDVGVGIIQRARVTNADGFGLRVDLGGAIPVGDSGNFQGAPGWTFAPMLSADYRFPFESGRALSALRGLTVTVNLGARIRDTAAVANIVWGSQLVVAAGLAYRPPPVDRLSVGVDFQALVPLVGARDNGNPGMPQNPVLPMELYFGARYAIDRGRDLEVVLGGGAPLSHDATTPAWRVIAGFSYAPRGLDNDFDKVPDATDLCPSQPEDMDGWEDADGCPEIDNDQDLVPDAQDHCPNVAEDKDNFEDDDGCPEEDNDHDGLLDADDQCPNEPQGDHPDPDHAGCPIPDRDNDGVLDGTDQCIDVPAGEHPDPVRAGCPMPDADHDGVSDDLDQCPGDPAGEHGDPARPGCPDPDRDHDGVPNESDRCPDEAETINGVTDDDGCPDEGDETVMWARNVIIFQNAVRLRAGTRALRPADAALFAQAAQRIRGRGARVARVRVEVVPAAGPRGTAEAERLAGLVADALAAHGIARESIVTAAATAAAGATPGEVHLRIEPREATAPTPATAPAPAPPPAQPEGNSQPAP